MFVAMKGGVPFSLESGSKDPSRPFPAGSMLLTVEASDLSSSRPDPPLSANPYNPRRARSSPLTSVVLSLSKLWKRVLSYFAIPPISAEWSVLRSRTFSLLKSELIFRPGAGLIHSEKRRFACLQT